MITQRNEEIEKQLRPTSLHLHLHGAASLEGSSRSDDEREVVRTEFGVSVGRVGVCIASRKQDGAALNAGFCCVLVDTWVIRVHV